MNATTKPAGSGKTVQQLNDVLATLALDIIKKQSPEDRKATLAKIDAIQKEIDDLEKSRGEAIKHIEGLVTMQGIKLTELSDAARAVLGAGTGGKAGGKAKGTGTKTSQKTGEVLISVASASGRGQPAKYNKGQALPQYVPAGFKALYEANKNNFDAKLAEKFTEAGKAYFAAEGKEELAKFVEFVKTKNVMLKK
ncbi:hypothetical protein [Roseateles sp. PN1]|uniref:hypothetical protein n=1 Tax=Roseateles sp. PN1 TaxID=3137372 RepID=UPI00313A4671